MEFDVQHKCATISKYVVASLVLSEVLVPAWEFSLYFVDWKNGTLSEEEVSFLHEVGLEQVPSLTVDQLVPQ